MDKIKKCVICQEKNAWIISPTVTNIPVYCRKCYCQKILKLKYLNNFCIKCGHKVNTCQKTGSKENFLTSVNTTVFPTAYPFSSNFLNLIIL